MNGIKRLGLDKINRLGLENNGANNFQKTLSIKFISASEDDKNYNLVFEVSQNNLTKFDATIFVEEMNATNEIAVPKTNIKLSTSQTTTVKAGFPKNTVFNKYIWQSGFSYQATITCDGISASTSEFRLIGTLKKAAEILNEKCLCKNDAFTEEDLRKIVTGIRKGEFVGYAKVDDFRKNRSWIDKNGNIIPSTDRGKKPPEAVKEYTTIVTKYEEKASDQKEIADRLFYMSGSAENINPLEANYKEFSKWMKFAIEELQLKKCIRKIHFLAQIYEEAQAFGSTLEKNTTANYGGGNFYKGRGFMQVTHDYNYLEFYDSINKTQYLNKYISKRLSSNENVKEYVERTNDIDFPSNFLSEFDIFVKSLASSMEMAMKSAIWYWKKMDINKYADLDSLAGTTAAINHPASLKKDPIPTDGLNGYDTRKKYYDILKTFFDYENCK